MGETINEEGDGRLREAGEWHSSKEARREGGKREKIKMGGGEVGGTAGVLKFFLFFFPLLFSLPPPPPNPSTAPSHLPKMNWLFRFKKVHG